LTEDLLLRLEVVVEGAVREPGALRDVGDPGVEETVLLEDLLGRFEQARPRAGTLARPRSVLDPGRRSRCCLACRHAFSPVSAATECQARTPTPISFARLPPMILRTRSSGRCDRSLTNFAGSARPS